MAMISPLGVGLSGPVEMILSNTLGKPVANWDLCVPSRAVSHYCLGFGASSTTLSRVTLDCVPQLLR